MTKSQTCEHLPAERKSVPFAFMRHGFESSAPFSTGVICGKFLKRVFVRVT